MQTAWHGEGPLVNYLDQVFQQGDSDQIDPIKNEVKRYEKDIKERGAAVVNQERAKAEKVKEQKLKGKKGK